MLDLLLVSGICPHLGCKPDSIALKITWFNAFFELNELTVKPEL